MKLKKFLSDQKGQALPAYILFSVILILFFWLIVESGSWMVEKMHVQNAADASALSMATFKARTANGAVIMNATRSMNIPNYNPVVISSSIGTVKLFVDALSGHPENINDTLKNFGLLWGGGAIYNFPGQVFGNAQSCFISPWESLVDPIIVILNGLILRQPQYDPRKNSAGAVMYGIFLQVMPILYDVSAAFNGIYGTIMCSYFLPQRNNIQAAIPFGFVFDFNKAGSFVGDVGFKWVEGKVKVASTLTYYASISVPIPFYGLIYINLPLYHAPDPTSGYEANMKKYMVRRTSVNNYIEFNRMDFLALSKRTDDSIAAQLFGTEEGIFYAISSATIYTDQRDLDDIIPTEKSGGKTKENYGDFNYLLGNPGTDKLNYFKPVLTMSTFDLLLSKVWK